MSTALALVEEYRTEEECAVEETAYLMARVRDAQAAAAARATEIEQRADDCERDRRTAAEALGRVAVRSARAGLDRDTSRNGYWPMMDGERLDPCDMAAVRAYLLRVVEYHEQQHREHKVTLVESRAAARTARIMARAVKRAERYDEERAKRARKDGSK